MKKLTMLVASAALFAGTPAIGGEIGGNGTAVPGGANGASECSYSGLNDTPDDFMGFTQTWASFWKFFGLSSPIFWDLHPGITCRG
ncbi:hypothetical protein [Altererythrobacter sp.]|uniref:hypothetical protein n=1 Tax=Altererythrobacter sp. TaxID=1872480 RepID=UPI001B0FA160|nr:hypothetical protein [Altererythrobacter sp.]MBO6608141.1 hypothetical protein [Altererythrobacter sp.]MBO6641603.1 hypothetical protein [Altererythrobacter sp.]MBO6707698.1 hypothetical protein [Altererythrobacter sp.]MBO6946170.1 hypothetical protein [Altererythrobacter sp.]